MVGNLRSSNVLLALNWEKIPVFVLKLAELGTPDPAPLVRYACTHPPQY